MRRCFATVPEIALIWNSCELKMEDKGKFAIGTGMRRAVLGDAHVDRAEANMTDFDREFQQFITETAWGAVWTRGVIDKQMRHMLTICILAALGKEHELALHIRATQNTGVTPQQLIEVFHQVAIYAGVPAANRAFGIAKQVFTELDVSLNFAE